MKRTIWAIKGNDGKWKWATESLLHPGKSTFSEKSYPSKRAALAAGRREFRV